MKIAFVIGHNENKQGAFSEYFGMTEFEFYKELTKDYYDVYFHNPNIKGYTKRIKNTMRKVDTFTYDLVICLHFNSFNKKANGVETLYYYASRLGRKYASRFSRLINNETGIRYRGVRALTNKKDRGFASVYYSKAPTILIEPFFGDNKNDCEKIKSIDNLKRIISKFTNENRF